jgi:hypothetical protein
MTPITSKEAEVLVGKANPPSLFSRIITHAPFREALKTWQMVPQSRVKILFYLARFWFFAWSGWVVLGYGEGSEPRSWLFVPLVLGIVLTIGIVIFINWRPALTFASLALSWLVIVWLVGSESWLVIWSVGSLSLLAVFGVALFIPMWHLEIRQTYVYLIEDDTPYSEGFALKSRPRPHLDAALQAELLAAGLTPELLDQFLSFGAPKFMYPQLAEKLKTHSEALLQRLAEQMADPKNRETTHLYVSAMNRAKLVWDKSKKMSVNLRLDQVITEGGSPVNIQLQFDFIFDPEAIRSPEFRLLLPKWPSMNDLETVLKGAMEGSARKEVKLHFVNMPLDSALTKGSIERFREVLPGKLTWAKDALGIAIRADSVQCSPIIHETVQEAETRMIAARAQAQADLARMKALLDHVILGGVPPKLLAGLMMVDQGFDTMALTHRADDMLDLPEADDSHKFLFYRQKYGFPPQPPKESLPNLVPEMPPRPAPPGGPDVPAPAATPDASADGASSETPPPHKPENPTPRPNRRGINIKKKQDEVIMKRGPDGVYRADDSDSE